MIQKLKILEKFSLKDYPRSPYLSFDAEALSSDEKYLLTKNKKK